ncbi:MAG: Gfo/Idh/MocA family oxidoreductase [Sphingomonas sp.]|nr:Gfo/Idh/MocA family oxidoreductase [Sphingomonas sp.]
MKQVFQDLSSGATTLLDCPAPQARPGHLLIDTTVSLISTGTERMLVDFGRSSFISKARQQPEKVRQVIAKARAEGLLTTIDAVRSKLKQPIPLGYSNVGQVREIGRGVSGFQIGDRVISNGPHADVVTVPVNLCARIPDGVTDEQASFAVLGAIGLQALRLAEPTLGEAFVVIGVGTIGLLTVQLLRANGCRVLAIDFDAKKLSLAASFGAETCNPAAGEDPVASGMAFSCARGVDGVIITASTKSSDPVKHAAQMCRKRGRIVLVGVTGLELNRADFYEKELSFQVSCSYGPGRLDRSYEQEGHDYPFGYVRWTEKRNIEAILDLIAAGSFDTSNLISHRFPFECAPEAFDVLARDKGAFGILLTYSHAVDLRHVKSLKLQPAKVSSRRVEKPVIAFIGAGNYASRVLIPAFETAGARLHTIASAGGASSALQGRQAGFENATSDINSIFQNPEIDTVVIATRHDSHAMLAVEALSAGKHVFLEKPLALTLEEIARVKEVYLGSNQLLTVGFNRRFSPLVRRVKELLETTRQPKAFVMVMNAGSIPAEHWTQDPVAGGGRIIGEACHMIDLMRFFADAPITSVTATGMGAGTAGVTEDKANIGLKFADGSFGTLHYLANGAPSFPKERVEVFVEGRTLLLDNFRVLHGFDWPGFRKVKLLRQNKGQKDCAAAFLQAIKTGGPPPIAPEELFEVATVTIEAAEQLRTR